MLMKFFNQPRGEYHITTAQQGSRSGYVLVRGFVRLAESTLTAIAYLTAGLFATQSLALIPQILPSVAIGIPIGAVLIRHVRAETFRRVCMSFDAWVVSFGISTLLRDLHLVESQAAYLVMGAVILLDAWLLVRFFSADRKPVITYAV